jgi:hypothetical protein
MNNTSKTNRHIAQINRSSYSFLSRKTIFENSNNNKIKNYKAPKQVLTVSVLTYQLNEKETRVLRIRS